MVFPIGGEYSRGTRGPDHLDASFSSSLSGYSHICMLARWLGRLGSPWLLRRRSNSKCFVSPLFCTARPPSPIAFFCNVFSRLSGILGIRTRRIIASSLWSNLWFNICHRFGIYDMQIHFLRSLICFSTRALRCLRWISCISWQCCWWIPYSWFWGLRRFRGGKRTRRKWGPSWNVLIHFLLTGFLMWSGIFLKVYLRYA